MSDELPQMPRERGCRLVSVYADATELIVLLDVDGRDLPVSVPVDAPTVHSIQHAVGLHHAQRCHQGREPSGPDLLIRAVRTAGAWPLCLLVRPGCEPEFGLRIVTADGPTEIDLEVVDAVGLLLSNRLPVAVPGRDHDPWEHAIHELLDPPSA